MAEKEDKKIKAGATGGEESKVIPPKEPKEEKKGKMIEVDGDLLRELIQSNKLLQQTVDQLGSNAVAKSEGLQVRRKTKDFDYFVRKWDGKIVLGFQNMGSENRPLFIYNIYDQALRRDVQFVNVLLEGESKPVTVDYVTFLRDADKVKARKISQVEHEDVKEYGMIPKKEMAENGYGMFETMVLVPVEVTTKTYTIKLKLPEDEGGKEVSINSMWLNM